MTPIRDQPLYLALFSSSAKVEPYRLTISSTEQLAHYATGQMTLPYTFDRNLAAVMPALWYCLHLPRSRFDFVPLGARPLKESQRLYLPHRLALVPVSLDPDLMSALNVDSPQVILLQDDLLEEAGDLISRLTGVARVILTSEMTQQQLQLHWDALHKIWEPSKATPIRVSRLITDPHLKACLLPAQFIVRNLQGGSDAHVPAEFSSQDETLRYALHCQAVMSLTARLENAGTTPEDAERMFPAKLVEEKTRFTCPITVAMWGLPAQSVTRQMKKSLTRAGIRFRASDAEVENCALRFVVAHRALSQGGIGFIADSIPDEAFNLLACLEATWAASTSVGQRPKPRVVWRILHQIGALMAASFTKAEEDAIRHATSVTAFCEFPFSLAVMADGSDPLGFSIPIH